MSYQSTTCPWQNLAEDDSAMLAWNLKKSTPDLQYIGKASQSTATPELSG